MTDETRKSLIEVLVGYRWNTIDVIKALDDIEALFVVNQK